MESAPRIGVTPRSYGVVMAVIEHTFVDDGTEAGASDFDFRERCNELRCRPSEREGGFGALRGHQASRRRNEKAEPSNAILEKCHA